MATMETKTRSSVADVAINLMTSNLPKKYPMLKCRTDRSLTKRIKVQAVDLPDLEKHESPFGSGMRRPGTLRRTQSESILLGLDEIKKELSRVSRSRKKKRNYRRNAEPNVFQHLKDIRDQHGPLDVDEVAELNKMIRSGASEAKISGWKRFRLARKIMVQRKKARQRFKRAIRMVVIIQRALSFILKRHKGPESREIMSFTDIANNLETETYTRTAGLSFDPRDYKAKKEIHISNEVKHVLSLPSSARKPEQLQTALYGMQTIRSFAEYPLHMQEKLVKVAWFETIPPKRVIIRQGHYAENFYFTISGSVVVTIMDSNSGGATRTAAVLRKGSSFGELALLHRSKRTATVSSQGHVQLLCIGREDFFDIFMRGQQPGQEPEHIQYLRKRSFMKYWPIEKFIEHPEMCLFHFYKRGQVIAKDSNQTDWIYIVMSGTCQVLKQLKAAKSLEVRLPRLSVDKRRKRKSGRKRSNTTVADYQFLAVPTLHNDTKTSEFQRLMSDDMPLPHTTLIPRRRTVSDLSEEKETASEPWSLTQTEETQRALPENNTNILPDIPDLRKGAIPRPSYSRSRYKEISALNGSLIPQNEHIPQLLVPRNNSPSTSSNNSKPLPTQSDISVFVQIELLQRRDVFGLSTLNMDMGIDHEQASVSLVSNGAECIMIKKDFFVKYCSDIVRRNIRTLTRPYPSPKALQHNLQSHADWSHYKQDKVADLVHDITRLRELRF